MIKSDANKIQNIILNLVGNAIKHTSKGSIKIRIQKMEDDESFIQDQIVSEVDQKELKIKIDVEDSGCGIPLKK